MSKYYGKQQEPPGRKSQKPKTPFVLFAAVAALALIIVGVIVLVRPGQARPGAAAGGGATAAGPRVAVDREKLDFGKVKMNTPVRAAFKVKNVGAEPLQILGQPQVRVVEGC